MTWRHHRWEELYRFPVSDLQVPEMPGSNDEKEVPGFIRKIKPGKIMVKFDQTGDLDSAIIHIR